jgi:hypothetical protein
LDHFTPGGSWTPTYGWTGSNTLTSPAINANALRITNNTLQEGFKRNITLAAKKYTFSFFMNKGLEDLNDKEYFSVDIINSTNAIVYTYTTKVNATGYYNFDYTATTAGTYTWRFRRVSLNGRSTSGIAYFDDFKVSSTIQQSQQVCSSPKNYRFGFNTQEKDDEVYGAGNLNTAEFWEYDTRLGRRWNLDPKPNVSISSYSVFANNPIFFSDYGGDTIRISLFNINRSPGISKIWNKYRKKDIHDGVYFIGGHGNPRVMEREYSDGSYTTIVTAEELIKHIIELDKTGKFKMDYENKKNITIILGSCNTGTPDINYKNFAEKLRDYAPYITVYAPNSEVKYTDYQYQTYGMATPNPIGQYIKFGATKKEESNTDKAIKMFNGFLNKIKNYFNFTEKEKGKNSENKNDGSFLLNPRF